MAGRFKAVKWVGKGVAGHRRHPDDDDDDDVREERMRR